MARAIAAGLVLLILANLAMLALPPGEPRAFGWAPAVLCLFAGIWLSVANRPSFAETAQLLDRHFKLHEALGTALECDAAEQPEGMAHKQLSRARSTVRGLPQQPWKSRRRVSWAAAVTLVAAAVLTTLIAERANPRPASQVVADRPVLPAVKGKALAQVAPNQAPLANPALTLPPLQQRRSVSSSQSGIPQQPVLATSLQVRTGPQLAANGGAQSGAPSVLAGNLNGNTSGSTSSTQQRSAGNGPSGSSQRAPGTGNGSRPGQPGNAQKQGGQGGTPGNGSTNSGGQNSNGKQQLPQSGPQANPSQGPNSAAGSGQNQGQSGKNSTQSSGNGTDKPGANPFGQDPSAAKSGQAGSKTSGGSQPHTGGTQSQSQRSQQSSGTKVAPNSNQNDAAGPVRRGSQGAGSAQTNQQPNAKQGKAGPATGKQVTIGGQPLIGNGNKGQEIVRVVPFSAASGPGLNGPNGGSATVEGYVPEEDMTLAPDEQALVRAYFSNGSGS
jgi:hypothetical protein